MSHTRMVKEVRWDKIMKSQRELSSHISMVIKIFKIFSILFWKRNLRVRGDCMIIFWIQKFYVQKNLDLKKLGPKKCWDQNIYKVQKKFDVQK